MAGPSATTIRSCKSWFWRPNTAARRQDSRRCANKNACRLRPFPRIGRRTAWCVTTRNNFPPATVSGVFIAFHGSWDRAPYPQGGYNVVFQRARRGPSIRPLRIFADGFAGAVKSPDQAAHRPSGLAVGPTERSMFRRCARTDLPNRLSRRLDGSAATSLRVRAAAPAGGP